MIPEATLSAFNAYVAHHRHPGHFLAAVLENNLSGAVLRVDIPNRESFFEVVMLVWNQAPSECWGSAEKVDAWLSKVEVDHA